MQKVIPTYPHIYALDRGYKYIYNGGAINQKNELPNQTIFLSPQKGNWEEKRATCLRVSLFSFIEKENSALFITIEQQPAFT